jgi:hypothetical protein
MGAPTVANPRFRSAFSVVSTISTDPAARYARGTMLEMIAINLAVLWLLGHLLLPDGHSRFRGTHSHA